MDPYATKRNRPDQDEDVVGRYYRANSRDSRSRIERRTATTSSTASRVRRVRGAGKYRVGGNVKERRAGDETVLRAPHRLSCSNLLNADEARQGPTPRKTTIERPGTTNFQSRLRTHRTLINAIKVLVQHSAHFTMLDR